MYIYTQRFILLIWFVDLSLKNTKVYYATINRISIRDCIYWRSFIIIKASALTTGIKLPINDDIDGSKSAH